jgi:hypothetical protein
MTTWWSRTSGKSSPRRWVVLAIVVAVAATATGVWLTRTPSAPVSLRQLHPTVTGMRIVTTHHRQPGPMRQAITELGGSPSSSIVYPTRDGQQYLVGRFTVDGSQRDAAGQINLLTVDNRDHLPATYEWSAPGTGVSVGWDARFDQSNGPSWLSEAADADRSDGLHAPSALGWKPGHARSFVFGVPLTMDGLPVTQLSQDLTVGVFMVGPGGQDWGALRLSE